MRLATIALIPILCSSPDLQAPPAAGRSQAVAEVANLRFHSDVLINLHHTLYAAAWAGRPAAASARALAGRLPAPLDAPMTDEERTIWTAAVRYYDTHLADRDLLFGSGMEALKSALVAGDLASDAVGRDLGDVLTSALPVYTRRFWPAHDRANREWISTATAHLRDVAPDVIARLETLYGVTWFGVPLRIDVVWTGNRQGAYTTDGPPPHVTISSGDANNAGWTAVEIVFHEVSHVLVLPLQDKLERALGDRARDHAVLWHVVQFYVTGAAVQQVLKAHAIEYEPYMYSTGLFERAWSRYRTPVESNWRPYVDGRITMDQAIAGTVRMVGTPPGGSERR